MLMYAAPSITEEVLLMISEETRRKLRELGMDAFVEALDNQEANLNNYVTLDFDKRLTIAVDEFYATKNRDRAKRLMLLHLASSVSGCRSWSTVLRRTFYQQNKIVALGTCGYISTSTNLVIYGYTGSGKTHLSCALGREACRRLQILVLLPQISYNLIKLTVRCSFMFFFAIVN